MVTLLCVSDKTHSHLMELMPERCGNGGVNPSPASNINITGNPSSQESASSFRDFETILQAVN